MKKKTAIDHLRDAHNSLLMAYATINPIGCHADSICRAMRNCALAMGQLPIDKGKKVKG